MPKREIHAKVVVVDTQSVDEAIEKVESLKKLVGETNQLLEAPEKEKSIIEVLLHQIALIEQESKRNPGKLAELTHALCEASEALHKWWKLN